jgi:hypothetical protein
MKVKYVIFDEMYAVLISKINNHSDVRLVGRPTSAGFCAFKWSPEKCGFEVQAWGESTSLGGMKSAPGDEFFIEHLLNG